MEKNERAIGYKVYKKKDKSGALVIKNVFVGEHRTSIRLETEAWQAFDQICLRERCTRNQALVIISKNLKSARSLTSAVRMFVLAYYMHAATERGHKDAGHSNGTKSIEDTLAK